MSASEAQIVIGLDLRATELRGVVRVEGMDDRRFIGWLGLLDALQRATSDAKAE